MKKTYIVQLIVDAVMIFLGLCAYFFKGITNYDPNTVFYTMMGVYAGLELCEYIFDRSRMEPFYIFVASAVGAFSGFFLHDLDSNFVLSLTIAGWMVMIALIKIINLQEIYEKYTHMFLIKLTSMSVFVLIGILVSLNIYYEISTICYMLAFIYLTYGVLEFSCDFLMYLSSNIKFLKE